MPLPNLRVVYSASEAPTASAPDELVNTFSSSPPSNMIPTRVYAPIGLLQASSQTMPPRFGDINSPLTLGQSIGAVGLKPGVILNSSSGGSGKYAFERRIADLEFSLSSELAGIVARLDALTVAVAANAATLATATSTAAATGVPDAAMVELDRMDTPIHGDSLAASLNALADSEMPGPPELLETVIQALSSDDAELRGAAGRALALCWPREAYSQLQAAIGKEEDRFTLAVLRGALEALD